MRKKYRGILFLFERLEKDAPVPMKFSTTRVAEQILYISSEKNVLYRIQATDTIVKLDRKRAFPTHISFISTPRPFSMRFFFDTFHRTIRSFHIWAVS